MIRKLSIVFIMLSLFGCTSNYVSLDEFNDYTEQIEEASEEISSLNEKIEKLNNSLDEIYNQLERVNIDNITLKDQTNFGIELDTIISVSDKFINALKSSNMNELVSLVTDGNTSGGFGFSSEGVEKNNGERIDFIDVLDKEFRLKSIEVSESDDQIAVNYSVIKIGYSIEINPEYFTLFLSKNDSGWHIVDYDTPNYW